MCCIFGYAIRIYTFTAIILVQLIPHFYVIVFMQKTLECQYVPRIDNLRFMFGYVAYFYRSKCINLTEVNFPIGFLSPSPDQYLWYRDHVTYTPAGTPSKYTWYMKMTEQYVQGSGGPESLIQITGWPRPKNRPLEKPFLFQEEILKDNNFHRIFGRKKREVENYVVLKKRDIYHERHLGPILNRSKKKPILELPFHVTTTSSKDLKRKNMVQSENTPDYWHKRKSGVSQMKSLTENFEKKQIYPTKHRLDLLTQNYGKPTDDFSNGKKIFSTYDHGRSRSRKDGIWFFRGKRPKFWTKISTFTTRKSTPTESTTSPKGLAKPMHPYKFPVFQTRQRQKNQAILKEIYWNLKNLNPEFWDEDKIEFLISLTDPINWILYFLELWRGELPPNSLVTMLTQDPYVRWPTWKIFDGTLPPKLRYKIQMEGRKNVTIKPMERGHNYDLKQWITYRGREWPEWWDNHTTQGWIKIQEQRPTTIMWPYETPQYGWVRNWVTIWLIMDILWAVVTFFLVVAAITKMRGTSSVFFYCPFLLVTFGNIIMDLVCAGSFALTIPNCQDFWGYLTFIGIRNVNQLKDRKKAWFPDYQGAQADPPWYLTIFFLRCIVFWFINVVIFFKVVHIFRRVVSQDVAVKTICRSYHWISHIHPHFSIWPCRAINSPITSGTTTMGGDNSRGQCSVHSSNGTNQCCYISPYPTTHMPASQYCCNADSNQEMIPRSCTECNSSPLECISCRPQIPKKCHRCRSKSPPKYDCPPPCRSNDVNFAPRSRTPPGLSTTSESPYPGVPYRYRFN